MKTSRNALTLLSLVTVGALIIGIRLLPHSESTTIATLSPERHATPEHHANEVLDAPMIAATIQQPELPPPPPETPAQPPPAPNEAVTQLHELSTQLIRQRYSARQRLDERAKNAGDLKDIIPAQAKKYQEPETVLTLARAFRDPQWQPLLSDFTQHRFGLDYIRQMLHGAEESLAMEIGFSSAQTAQDLRAMLFRSEPLFQQRSDGLAAKFQFDATLTYDARDAAACDTLQTVVKAYRYWTINKNREE